MQNGKRSTALTLILAGLAVAGCRNQPEVHAKVEPAHVEHLAGSEISRLTLTPKAMERLDIQTGLVQEAQVTRASTPQKVVPYAAVLYDPSGRTWVYTRSGRDRFVRHEIVIDYIEGSVAVLTEGPPVGTEVVTVGGAELFGTEFEVGH